MAKKELNEDVLSGASISDSGNEKTEKKPKKAKTKKSKKGLSKNAVKAIKSVVACVIVVALLVAYIGTGAVRKGFVHSTLQWTTAITAVTVKNDDGDKIKVPVSTFNYYFAMLYNNMRSSQQTYEQYGLDLADAHLDVDFDKPLSSQTTTNDDDETVTWLEYMYEETLESIKSTYMYYNEAVKANGGEEPEITDDQKAELEDTVNQYKESANGYGYTTSGYLVQAFGKGVTEKVFRQEAIKSYIAQNYQSQLSEEYSATDYTDEDYQNYKSEHTSDLETVSLRIFEASSEDDAKAFYGELKADGSNFTDLCVKYSSSDFDKSYYGEDGASTKLYATRSALQNGGYAITTATTNDDGTSTNDGLDWIFSTDRSSGDKTQVSTSVVYMIAPVAISDVQTVSVRHILIAPETDDENTSAKDASADQWKAALESAQNILNEFKTEGGTEEDFAALASQNSTDTGSSSNGGLYENVTPGQMVDTFSTWCFDSDRKSGDTAIVQSQYGYHIMYFVGQSGMPVWQYTAQQSLASDDSTAFAEKLKDSYTVSFNWFGKFYIEKDTDIDH